MSSAASESRSRGGVAAWALAFLAVLASVVIALARFGGVPHVADEVAYLFQARVLAAGEVSAEPPALPGLFAQDTVPMRVGLWGGRFPPGWPLILASGAALGVAWLIAPLLVGVAVLGVWRLAADCFDGATALASALLLATSPFVLISGAGMMAHVPAMAISVWCMVMLHRGRTGSAWHNVLAGVLGALVVAIRPLSAVTLLAVFLIWALAGERTMLVRRLGLLAAGALPLACGWLVYHAVVFGDPFVVGYRFFSPDHGLRGHGPDTPSLLQIFAANFPRNAAWLNHAAWGWPGPDLLIALGFPLLLAWRSRDRGVVLALVGTVVAHVVGQSCYFWTDIVHGGPRMVLESMAPLSIAAGWGLVRAVRGLKRGAGRWGRFVAPIVVGGLAAFLGWGSWESLGAELRRIGPWYHGASLLVVSSAAEAGVGPEALIFVGGARSAFSAAFNLNAIPPARGAQVWLRDPGPALRQQVVSVYPRPETWLVEVELARLEGPNRYSDTFDLVGLRWTRLDVGASLQPPEDRAAAE